MPMERDKHLNIMIRVDELSEMTNAKLFLMKEERMNKFAVLKKQVSELTKQMNELSVEYNAINEEMRRRSNVRTSYKH